jgi:hypothetical protein
MVLGDYRPTTDIGHGFCRRSAAYPKQPFVECAEIWVAKTAMQMVWMLLHK